MRYAARPAAFVSPFAASSKPMTHNGPTQTGTNGLEPMRLGLFDIMQLDPVLRLDPAAMYRGRLDNLALADELGFDVAFVAERHYLANYACPSATAWVAAAAARTERIRLGVLAYTLPIRAPVQLAEEIAMLDQLSGGRLEIGVGLGHRVEELVALGVDPARRIPIYQERLALLQALWSGGVVSFERPDVAVRDVAIHPLPVQAPHPPLWHAGTEPVGAHWAGGHGMGLAVGFAPTTKLQPAAAAYLAGREARSNEVRSTEPPRSTGTLALMRHVYVADSDARARREVVDDLVRLGALHSSVKEGSRTDRRAEAEERFAAMRRDEVMIAGGPESVADAVKAARAALRIDLFLANVYAAGVEPERVQRTLRLLAGEVKPRLVVEENVTVGG